jgi:O-acetylserine/cysteine efflux transporter
MTQSSLSWPHALLAIAVTAVWGTNFVVIRLGLDDLPPLLFAALRFTFAALPAVFFLPRPDVPWRRLAAYGLLIGVGQFGLLFIAMQGQISPGLASLVVQSQVFFTIALSMRATGERVQPVQWFAVALAASGVGLIAARADADATPIGLTLVLLAALCWAGGNTVTRASPRANMLAYVVWSSLFAVPPLFVLSLLIEGPTAIAEGLGDADAVTWAAVLWQSVGNSLFGYAAWGWLLARYPAATIAPLSLLVPVFGMAASAWWLGEDLPLWKIAAAGLILAGLAINILWTRISALRAADRSSPA